MKKLKTAILQYKSCGCDIEKNTARGLDLVRKAKHGGADIVLFPECWITGYDCPDAAKTLPPVEELERNPDFQRWYEQALIKESEPILKFRALAAELSIGIVITSLTKGVRHPQNTAFMIGRDGGILLKYSKVHTCDFDWEQYLESGDGFHVCRFDDICIGVMICYDREYPESARELMLQGAEIILVPNDCDTMRPRLQELSVRAMENMVGIAMANPPGENAGRSCAYTPMIWGREDNTLILAGEYTEGIVYADFDMDAIRAYRAEEDLGRYRKIKAYRHLTENKEQNL